MKQQKRTSKFIISLIPAIIIALLFSVTFVWKNFSSEVSEEAVAIVENTHNHSDMTAWTSTNSLPTGAGNYYLNNDVTLSSTWNVPTGTTNLCLNGHGIKRTGTGKVIEINNGATLNLYDCGETEHRFTVNSQVTNGAGLAVVNDTLTENYQTFVGGYITGGNGSGAGVLVHGTFNMYGGNIIGNYAPKNNGANGGGVCVNGSNCVFTMYGGRIAYNNADTGGAVFVEGGSKFILDGGLISYNRSEVRAGAIFDRGSVEIRSGEISNNYNTYEKANINLWGGTIEITGGIIKDNVSANSMSGIEFTNMSLGGSPVFVNNKNGSENLANFYMYNNGRINIVSPLDDIVKENKIGITLQSGAGVFTSGWSTYMGNADPADYFFSESEGYDLLLIDGEARLLKQPYSLISFEPGIASGTMSRSVVENGTTYTLPTTSTFNAPVGKALCGWKLGDTFYNLGETIDVTEDITLVAQWTDGVTVNFDSKGAGEIKSQVILPGTQVAQPAKLTKSGYTFMYWTLNGQQYDFSTPVTEDINLVALWAKGVGVEEDFENFDSNGWTLDVWSVATGDYDSGKGAHSGSKNMLAFKSSKGGESWLIMPSVDFTGMSKVEMSFWYINRSWGGDIDGFGFYYRVNGGDWQEIYKTTAAHDGWTEWSGELPSGALTANVELGFWAGFNWGYGVGIDDIFIEAITPHTHDWNETVDGNFIIETCSGNEDGTCLIEPQTYLLYNDIRFKKWTSTNSLPTEEGNYYLTTNVALSSTWNVPSGTTNLCLNGHVIDGGYKNRYSVITINNGSTLNLYEYDETEHYYYIGVVKYNGYSDALTYIGGIADGVEDSRYANTDPILRGSFKGGYITGGRGQNPANSSRIAGGGVMINNGGTFNMYGGCIFGNYADSNSYNGNDGGGVCVNSEATFNMNGGYIIGNQAGNNGGGVLVLDNAIFNLNDGEIRHNAVGQSGWAYGGGVWLGSSAKFNMTGGSISYNISFDNINNRGTAGGVCVNYENTFIMTGGTICNNIAKVVGAGVYGPITISGNVEIYGNKTGIPNGDNVNDNVYLTNSEAYITIAGELNNTIPIGVTMQNVTGKFTSGFAGNGTSDNFVSDRSDLAITLNEAGEAEIYDKNSVAVIFKDGNSTYYTDLNSAISAWKNGGTLKLIKDCSYSSTLEMRPMYGFNGNDYVLDLNNKTLSIVSISLGENNSPNRLRTGIKLTIKDSGTNGKIQLSGCNMVDYGGLIELRGGTITGGNGRWGGAFLLHIYGALDMYDGVTLTGNYSSEFAAGVFVGSDSEFNMYGGKICNNTASNYGGGVVTSDNNNAVFNMYGGEISNNQAPNGGGVAILTGKFNISGNAVIKDNYNGTNSSNVYLNNGRVITIAGELGTETIIGVTMQNTTGVFTSGLSGKGTINNFFADNDALMPKTVENELQLVIVVATVISNDSTTKFDIFADALSAWVDGSTLKLLKDVTGQVNVSSGTKVLDLNNHSITYTSGSVVIVSGGKLTIQDSSENKTRHYYTPNQTGVATLSSSETQYYFDGGYITGGVATEGRGGGFRVTGGEINFVGGTIFACRAGWGGGIWTAGTSLLTISDSAAVVGNYSSGNYTSGGGIFCEGSGAINMTGGSIRHNSSQFSGAGVRVCLQETTGTYFTMTGGEITGNYSGSHQGSGLALDMANRIKIGGSAKIYGNDGDDLFLKNGGYITVVEPFTEGALVNVKTQTAPQGKNYITFTDAWSTIMGDNADKFDNYFICNNNEDYKIDIKDGELVVAMRHVHEWTYTANGNVITATCAGMEDETCWLTAQTITLNAVGKVFDNQPVLATLTVSNDWLTDNGLAQIGNIVYSGNTNAGTYTASITVGGVTATKSFTISQADVTITVTGNNNATNYDGQSHSISGYNIQVTDSSNLYDTTKDLALNGEAKAERTNAGTTYMGLAEKLSNTNNNFNVTFNITDGYQAINKINATVTITGHNSTVDYDGQEHTISGYDVAYSTTLYNANLFTFSGNAVATRTNFGTTNMGLAASQFANTSENFNVVTFLVTDGYQAINKINATVTITGHNSTVDYNGQEHTISGYDVAYSTTLYNANLFTFSGNAVATRTNFGKTDMGLAATQFANTSENFNVVTFLVTDGYQAINKINATVTITGHNNTVDYDGTEHKVTGYDVEYSTTLYNANLFTFSGNAVATRTNYGTTNMGLAAIQFANISENFDVVTFVVTDGYQAINKINATVTITGHNSTVDYNGQEHKVTGYDVAYSTNLYNDTLFTFSGNAVATRTNYGTTNMGLAASQFANTSENFDVVTFVVTDGYQAINKIDVTVIIIGNTGVVNYDGENHIVSGYRAISTSSCYQTIKDFVFNGTAEAQRTDAGTTYMGLNASMFENINPNIRKVTFNVTDGYQTINKIDVTVTITGQTSIVDYDGENHSVNGYDAVANSNLYDVTKDFTFSGTSEAGLTNVGTVEMGLDASMFENTNENFNVTFNITDGYQTVNSIDVEFIKTPEVTELTYNGTKQQLISEGEIKGGTLYYALGTNGNTLPADRYFSTTVPTAKNVGYYYVWYKVIVDDNYNDFEPVCYKVIISESDWTTLSGVLYQNDGVTPISGAKITLVKGNQEVDVVTTDDEGNYLFKIEPGVYNIIAEYGNNTETTIVSVFESLEKDFAMQGSKTESLVQINDENNSNPGIAVGGLDKEAYSIRELENVPDDVSVSVLMTVELSADNAEDANYILEFAKEKTLEFFEIKVEKTINSVTTFLYETANVLEIAVPYANINRHDLTVYSYHNSSVKVFTEIGATDVAKDGTFRVDKANGIIYIYSSQFSTFAIGYTPYYNLNSSVSISHFKGNINATLVNKDTEETYKLENVSLKNLNFNDIPKGHYTLTITWEDGALNTITISLNINETEISTEDEENINTDDTIESFAGVTESEENQDSEPAENNITGYSVVVYNTSSDIKEKVSDSIICDVNDKFSSSIEPQILEETMFDSRRLNLKQICSQTLISNKFQSFISKMMEKFSNLKMSL